MIPFKSIKVGPFDIEIVELDEISSDDSAGKFNAKQMRIAIARDFRNQQQLYETLLHELLHAIWEIYGCKHKDTEERIISQMSIGMASVIRDNQRLIDFLKKSLS